MTLDAEALMLSFLGSVLKSQSHLPKKIVLLKMMKHVFYFVLKTFFVLEIFKFLSRRFGYPAKTAWLEREG